jgi:hypothetical protein
MPDAFSLPPPIDPDQTSAWLDAQRKQQIAQMLMGSMQQANQTPANWDSMKVVPKRGALQNLSVLADALLASKGLNASNQATAAYMNPQPKPTPTGPGAGIISPDAPPEQQVTAQQVSAGQAPPGLVQPRTNPMVPPNMTPAQAQRLMMIMGPGEYAKALIAPQFAPLEVQRQLRAAGIDPNSPQGRAVQRAIIEKQTTNVQDVRPGSTLFDVNSKNPIFTGPDNGVSTTWGADGKPVQAAIPGAAPAIESIAKAKTSGTQSATPIKLGTDENGKDIYGYPAPPGGGSLNATAPSATASAADIESQKEGAKAGQAYAAELAKNAAGATEVRRSISELKNLSQQATPGAANEAKAKLGAFMIAAGADPANVSKWTGVDTGALQAAQKQTATLAVNSIHSMTSRGTNFDLDTFMRNNPNMNMADPAAFARVADYMNNKASQDIAKQKDFAQGVKSGAWGTRDMWETNHSAHWNELQNADIDKGLSNSANPSAVPKVFATEAAAQAAATAGLIKTGDRIKIGNQTGTWH